MKGLNALAFAMFYKLLVMQYVYATNYTFNEIAENNEISS